MVVSAPRGAKAPPLRGAYLLYHKWKPFAIVFVIPLMQILQPLSSV
jgi:hypothetical protein